jgi:DNA-binding SARP family transcriptional activator
MANKIGLELDQLNNDLESARRRMQWFAERGLMNGVNIAKRYFPALADSPRPLTLEPKLRLEVLGTLQIIQQNESQPMTNQVRGRKRQELLALLLEARIAGRSEVSRLTLLDILYPDEDELKASSSLKSVVHSLRETFGERLIATTTNGYSLGNCNSDAEAFLQNRDISLWRGLYLEGLEFASESPVRDSLYLALHSKLQEVLEEQPEEAARVASILIEAESYNTDYLKTYLTALRLSNSHAKLVRHFEAAKKRLLEVGESLPKTWQHFLKVA